MGKIYNIPAGAPFAKSLAHKLFEETKAHPEHLADIRIFLPTRRACRVLRESFLEISNGKSVILPRMQPLGDVDDEELLLSFFAQQEEIIELPPPISALKREILLARLISGMSGYTQGPIYALNLAKALAKLMDHVYTENLNLENLNELVPEEFAAHWQITIDFLKIISEHWPKILKEQNTIDATDWRNRALFLLAQSWERNPPKSRIIAAGTTGSIPATANLIKSVYALENGEIILPGLDQDLDEGSWQILEEAHPQYGLKTLLDKLEVQRQDVQVWKSHLDDHDFKARNILACEIMRPAQKTAKWMDLKNNQTKKNEIQKALKDIYFYECAHESEEAKLIAVCLREVIETPNLRATLVTPDRLLAKRVRAFCRRWDLDIDDSAGESLRESQAAIFFNLIIKALTEEFLPISFLSLAHNVFFKCADKKIIRFLDKHVLRGPEYQPGIKGFLAIFENLKIKNEDGKVFLQNMEKTFEHLKFFLSGKHPFKKILEAHIQCAENLSMQTIWENEEGEELWRLLMLIEAEDSIIGETTLLEYSDILSHFIAGAVLRENYRAPARLKILGQLEARLIDSDLVILAGLNEGTWPPEPDFDPWMSRPMRKQFGLPAPERGIGLAAHDFVQGLSAPHVILTRAKQKDAAPTVPARWLTRLESVLKASDLDIHDLKNGPHKQWAQAIDIADDVSPMSRPAPKPPVQARPRALPVTAIETWLQDPYAIYARYILNLKPLDPYEQPIDAALKGQVIHTILERFVKQYPKNIPPDASHELHKIALNVLDDFYHDKTQWHIWWPRFERLCSWLLKHEKDWRTQANPMDTEIEGKIVIKNKGEDFILKARVDRIDKFLSGGAAIIDYKTGGTFSIKGIANGDLPQLGLEALVLSQGGFEQFKLKDVKNLSYWILSGGNTPGECIELSDENQIQDLIHRTHENLKNIIECFDNPQTPYYCMPRPDFTPRFNRYEHLARFKEWSAYGETESEAA